MTQHPKNTLNSTSPALGIWNQTSLPWYNYQIYFDAVDSSEIPRYPQAPEHNQLPFVLQMLASEMMSSQKKVAAYGTWASPISTNIVAGSNLSFAEVHTDVR